MGQKYIPLMAHNGPHWATRRVASGWSGVDTSSLIRSLDAMRDRLQSLAALPEPTLA